MPEEISIQEIFQTLLKDRILRKYRFNIQNNLNDFAYHLSTMEGKKLLKENPLDQATVDELLDKIPEIVGHDIVLTINGYIFLAHLGITSKSPDLAQKPLNYALEIAIKVLMENRGTSTQMLTDKRRDLLNDMEPFVNGIINFLSKSKDVSIDKETQAEIYVESGLMLLECARKTALETGKPLEDLERDNNGKPLKEHDRLLADHTVPSFHQGLLLLSEGCLLTKTHNITPDKTGPLANHISNSAALLLTPEDDPDSRKKNLETALTVAKNIEDEKLISAVTLALSS